MTRNERRKSAKQRLELKSARIAKAELARLNNGNRAIVKANLASPIVVETHIRSCLANLADQSHRGYVCRAGGGMDRRRAMALKARGSW